MFEPLKDKMMFGFFRPSKIYPDEAHVLSDRIDAAWKTWKKSWNAWSRQDAFRFLVSALNILPNQPRENIERKVLCLMLLKISKTDKNYIPDLDDFPGEIDNVMIERVTALKEKCTQALGTMFVKGGIPYFKYQERLQEIIDIRSFEKAVKIHIELTNALYTIRSNSSPSPGGR